MLSPAGLFQSNVVLQIRFIKFNHRSDNGHILFLKGQLRLIRNARPGQIIHQPVHDHVLVEGKILQMEYITNLWSIGSPTCTLICLPLNTQNANGSQIRVIAVVDE